MAKKTLGPPQSDISDYRHEASRRKNNPPAGIAGHGAVEKKARQVYAHDPHLPPVLRFDPRGKADALRSIVEAVLSDTLAAEKWPSDRDELEAAIEARAAQALTRALQRPEVKALVDAMGAQPWLEWSGKREKQRVEVDPVALHIHERVSARAILQVAAKQTAQRALFADPVQSYREAVQFYQHEVGWANRIILGDSLAVMSSLAVRENLAGKVQMIYMDPPYGIRFASNFQPVVGQRDVKDKETDLTREPEVVKAFRDTWELGVHTYLGYLRDRLRVARDLLTESGSIFVQISDENLHRVRMVMDEVFRPENFQAQIAFSKTSGATAVGLPSTADHILWYAKNTAEVRYQQLFRTKVAGGLGAEKYDQVQTSVGERIPIGQLAPTKANEARRYALGDLTSQSVGREKGEGAACWFPVSLRGAPYRPTEKVRWKTNEEGMARLLGAERIESMKSTLRYVRFVEDFPAFGLTNQWSDVGGIQSRSDPKVYVVQTSTTAIERCMMMTTDPGDLVLDPTCGSGTTAYVAEQWGRRWITIDSSRVALFIARQRLLTATYDYYKLRDSSKGVAGGFINKTVPHITLKSIAQNKALDPIFARHMPILAERLATLNAALARVTPTLRARLDDKLAAKKKAKNSDDPVTDADERRWLLPKSRWEEWEVPFDTDPDWPQPLQDALTAYRAAWRAKMDEVNACIDRHAEQEELVDQPDIDRKVLRVSGPFTVEGVEPAALTLDEPTPIAEPEGDLPLFMAESPSPAYGIETANADAYVEKMLRLLRADGVRFMGNRQVRIDRLDRRSGGLLTAEGDWTLGEAEPRRVAVVVGPQYGPVTGKAVENAVHAALMGGFEDLLIAGFAFDAEATGAIDDDAHPRLRLHLAHIRPDVQMESLLKDTPNSQIFTVFGSPRSHIEDIGGGEFVAHMEGMDVYDPVANALFPTGAEKVAAWFLDTDYDGRTFCVTQAFFPDRSAWDKLARALRGTLEDGAFEKFSGKKSLPFRPGKERRAAVKVIDPRGNEVMRIHSLPEGR